MYQTIHILDSSKLKEFADDNLKLDEKGGKLSKWEENTVEKGEIARYDQFLHFPQCFQRTCTYRQVKTTACLGKSSIYPTTQGLNDPVEMYFRKPSG